MPDTVITVRGEFSAWYPAERATVSVDVHLEAADRDHVFASVAASAERVRASIAPIVDAQTGPITWWSSDSVQVWNTRPWSNDGAQLPLVFHARQSFTVKFSDFTRLARWVEDIAAIDGLSIGGIIWALTDAKSTSVTTEVRSRAVKDAVSKASVYAQSIGLGTVRAIAIADPGMLGDQGVAGSGFGGPEMRMMKADAMMSAGSAPELSLKPEDIAVAASVDARFVAS
jgi:uncharacterized protein YggE